MLDDSQNNELPGFKTQIANLNDQITYIFRGASNIETRLTTFETRLSHLESRLASIDKSISKMAVLKDKMHLLEATIHHNNSSVSQYCELLKDSFHQKLSQLQSESKCDYRDLRNRVYHTEDALKTTLSNKLSTIYTD